MLKNDMKEEYAKHVLTINEDFLFKEDDQIFEELLRRAGTSMDKYMEASEEYKSNDQVDRMYSAVNAEMEPVYPSHIDPSKLAQSYSTQMYAVDSTFESARNGAFSNK